MTNYKLNYVSQLYSWRMGNFFFRLKELVELPGQSTLSPWMLITSQDPATLILESSGLFRIFDLLVLNLIFGFGFGLYFWLRKKKTKWLDVFGLDFFIENISSVCRFSKEITVLID